MASQQLRLLAASVLLLMRPGCAFWPSMLRGASKAQDAELRQPNEQPLLFVAIYTAPGESGAARREEIRETYWNHPLLQPGGKIQARFVVGYASPGSAAAETLDEEVDAYPEQFLRLNMTESYDRLTRKTMATLRWFADNSNAKWMLKLDDDTFPHFEEIVDRLEKETDRYVEMGMLWDCAPVLKETKWAEDPYIYNYSHFPKYMQGSGYFLSADLVRELAHKRYEHNLQLMLNNEDAAIGTWIEFDKAENPSFPVKLVAVPSTLCGCEKGDLLSMNNQPGYIKCYWNRMMRGEEDVCCHGPKGAMWQSLLQVNTRKQQLLERQAAAVAERFKNQPQYEDDPLKCFPSSVPSESLS